MAPCAAASPSPPSPCSRPGAGATRLPQVTFTAADTSVTARPTQYCDLKLTECSDDAAAPVRLAVPAGTPLQGAVPDDVAEAPWHVVFSYRNEGGEQVDARSPLFAADEQHDYTLTLPAPADRLVTAAGAAVRARRRRSTRTRERSSSRSAAAGC